MDLTAPRLTLGDLPARLLLRTASATSTAAMDSKFVLRRFASWILKEREAFRSRRIIDYQDIRAYTRVVHERCVPYTDRYRYEKRGYYRGLAGRGLEPTRRGVLRAKHPRGD